MIRHISIDDFAVIQNTEIDFQDGLNVITGETGAGKSIVIEAMSLALGSRADSSFVRHGAKKAKIQLLADLNGEEISVVREVSASGRNLCRLNGDIVPLSVIQQRISSLADIHGQYDNQTLLDPDSHLPLVDEFRKEEIGPAHAAFEEAYEVYKSARGALDALLREEKETRRMRDLYQYEAEEIEGAALKPGEEEDLTERASVLRNSEKIAEAAAVCGQLLSDPDHGALQQMEEARSKLDGIRTLTRDLEEWSGRLESLCLDLEDLTSQIDRLADQVQYEPGELDWVINRLAEIDGLKKKYGGTIEAVLARGERARTLLERAAVFGPEKARLEQASKEALRDLRERADALSEKRRASAEALSQAVERELRELNFQDARFTADIRRASAISRTGQDTCEFMISTNRGEPLKPLAKTASGGEISRVMLAIKTVTAASGGPEALIFDEVDQGISGITASVVARKLRKIAAGRQVICITHLPQIAAAADHSYRIYKDTDEQATYTHVEALDGNDQAREIARLLGGDQVTETTLSSARELIGKMRGAGK